MGPCGGPDRFQSLLNRILLSTVFKDFDRSVKRAAQCQ